MGNDSMIIESFASSKLQLDIPFFYSLNDTTNFDNISNLSGLILVGINPRFETAILNTKFRNAISQRNFNIIRISVFTSLRYSQIHQGNTFRTLYSILENRINTVKINIGFKIPVGILLGVNNLRNAQATHLQHLVLNLGKSFFVKMQNKDRLGYLHSSVGSLSFAFLGYTPKKTNIKTPVSTLFTVNQPNYSQKFFNWKKKIGYIIKNMFVFDTHFDINIESNFNSKLVKDEKEVIILSPITSFYENDGHIIDVNNRLRRHSQVIENPIFVRTFDIILAARFYSIKLRYPSIYLRAS